MLSKLQDYIKDKTLDFLWWLADSDYEWWSNIFYPIYQVVADKLIK